MFEKIKLFVGEVSKEMKKVSWPNKEQLKESTWVTIITCILITAFTFVIDYIMTVTVEFIF